MSCHELPATLDELLDGELDAAAEQTLREHLAACPSCRVELEASERLRQQTAALPRSLEPSRDLWPAIAGRLATTPRARAATAWWTKIAAAAAAAIVGAVGLGSLVHLLRDDGRPTAAAQAPTVPAVSHGASELEQARGALLAAFEQRRGSLSDETLTVVLDALAVIDGSITAIGHALEQHPGDAGLTRRLAAAYQQEIALLQRATRLPNET